MTHTLTKDRMKSQVMVLAAGRGERMRPLSDVHPKPLLKVQGTRLIEWTLKRLQSAGYAHALINTAWLGEQVRETLGTAFTASPSLSPLELMYSNEDVDFGGALETAGGIVRALPHLSDPFWVVAADAFCPDFDFNAARLSELQAGDPLAHLWLVDNPSHHPKGDFCLSENGLASLPESANGTGLTHQPTLTFSTIGIYKHAFFKTYAPEIPDANPLGVKLALGPLLKRAIKDQQVLATHYHGPWVDVGTPERLALLNPT
jgi:MurNAc alpha-1-phosphate uridylyltransferase